MSATEARSGRATAPGKVILAGEHFVVHGAPALALPVRAVGKEVTVTLTGARRRPGDDLVLELDDPFPDGGRLRELATRALELLALEDVTRLAIGVRSTLAPGAHLGSSASLAVALLAALGRASGRELAPRELAGLAYELERIVHGNPSGIDNTVVALDRAVRFVRGAEPAPFAVAVEGALLVADSGRTSRTADVVADVARFRDAEPHRFEAILEEARELIEDLTTALGAGDGPAAGALMTVNQGLLAEIGTSAPDLEAMIAAACRAGAWGAKLTGAGRGGNVIALVPDGRVAEVRRALAAAGGHVLELVLPIG